MFLCLRKSIFLLAKFQCFFIRKVIISGKYPHYLFAFLIHFCLSFSRPWMLFQYWLDAIGILLIVKNLFNSSKVAEHPPLLGAYNACPNFHCFIKMRTVEQSVKTGNQCSICRCKNKQGWQWPDHLPSSNKGAILIHSIVENTLPKSLTSSACNAASYIFVTNLNCRNFQHPFSWNTFSISRTAMAVFPFNLGLPLIINTLLIICTLLTLGIFCIHFSINCIPLKLPFAASVLVRSSSSSQPNWLAPLSMTSREQPAAKPLLLYFFSVISIPYP